ncbi:MAG TPA: tetratricopeptide repeat protein [Candidatus Sulfotelmatobacter sp.]|nr:tetratricopeptide repeat protein [Candidatus Sulfotelmatobacter sp.]
MAVMPLPARIAWLTCLSLYCVAVCLHAPSVVAQSSPSTEIERYSENAQRALAQGNYSEAEQSFLRLSELEPGVAEVHANLGLIYFQEGRFEQAIPALRRALKLKPSLAKSSNLLAMSLSEIGRYGDALPGLEKCFPRSPDAEIKRMCGLELQRAYTGQKRDNKAVEVAMELNRLYPDDPEILYQTGKIYGNFAFLTMAKLAQVAPTSVWRHLAAAEAHESQGSYDQAIAEYREVLKLEPSRPGIHYRMGRTLMGRFWQRHSADDPPAAQKEFEQELQIDPGNASSAYELGEMRRKARQFDDAQRYFEQALQHYPDFAEAQLGLGAVLLEKKLSDQALVHVQRAVAIDPENEVAWYRLAQTEKALGHAAEQQKALTEYRRLHDRTNQQHEIEPVFSPREVTKQEVDPNAAQ